MASLEHVEMSDSNCCCVHIVCSTCSHQAAPATMATRGNRRPRTRSRQFAIATRDGSPCSPQRAPDTMATRNNNREMRKQVVTATRRVSSGDPLRAQGGRPARTRSIQYDIATRDDNHDRRQVTMTTKNKQPFERNKPEKGLNRHEAGKFS